MAKPCPVKSEKRVWGSCYRDLQASRLTIGIASGAANEDYRALAAYLRDQLSQVEIDKTRPSGGSQRESLVKIGILHLPAPNIFHMVEDNRFIMFPTTPYPTPSMKGIVHPTRYRSPLTRISPPPIPAMPCMVSDRYQLELKATAHEDNGALVCCHKDDPEGKRYKASHWRLPRESDPDTHSVVLHPEIKRLTGSEL